MPTRKRNRFKEQRCFFITTTFTDWLPLLMDERYFAVLYYSLRFLNNRYGSYLLGYVFMPNHIHLILYFEKENNLSDYMREFKKHTALEIRKLLEKDNETGLLKKLEYKNKRQVYRIWKNRFDDLHIKTKEVLLTKLNYIHKNPVDYGLCENWEDYPHSSAAFYYSEEVGKIEVLDFREVFV